MFVFIWFLVIRFCFMEIIVGGVVFLCDCRVLVCVGILVVGLVFVVACVLGGVRLVDLV